ncbi:DUF6443 domain-containing protein [Tenacibaculum sp. 190524A02b]|uniref:DUF6443 domain-containing protein n=1 Tax=Tenacibaculum vairaonense TaxID=3137860 RepID=UPI0032B21F21
MRKNINQYRQLLYVLGFLLIIPSIYSQKNLISSEEHTPNGTPGDGPGGKPVKVTITAKNHTPLNDVTLNDEIIYEAKSTYTLNPGKWHVQNGIITKKDGNSVTIKWNYTGSHHLHYVSSTKIHNRLAEASLTVTVHKIPNTPAIPIIVFQDCHKAILQKDSSPSGVTWYWQGANSNGTSTSNHNTTYSVTTSGKYYLRARNKAGDWSTNSIYIDVTLGVKGGATWYADQDNDGFGDPTTTKVQCTQPQGYVSNASDQCPYKHGGVNENGCPSSGISNKNYIYTITPQKAVLNINELTENKDAIENVTYFDGLGRPEQAINIEESSTEKDIVTHITYDTSGRQVKEFLPYPSEHSDGRMNSSAENATKNYYKTIFPKDFPDGRFINAYSEKKFDNSPLNRITKQAAPGRDWRLSGGHEIEYTYLSNTSVEAVKQFHATTKYESGIYTTTLQSNSTPYNNNGYYKEGQLYKTVTKNENHINANGKLHTTEEFKNKKGQVILKRTYAKVNSMVTPHDTYYVYDDYGNLSYVIPPKVNVKGNVSVIDLNELCYQYRYDKKNRLVEKKIPGKGWEYIIYDKLNRPILTQDTLQRAKPHKEWLFTKYDEFDRVIYTGLYKNNGTRRQLQTSANNSVKTSETYTGTTEPNTLFFYTDHVFPTNIPYYDVHTINYYDKNVVFYGDGDPSVPSSSLGVQLTKNMKGLLGTTKSKVLGVNNKWVTTQMGYDEKGRIIYTSVKNSYLNSLDVVETQLDFAGKILQTKTTHTKDNNAAIVTLDSFTYDHSGRTTKQIQKVNNQPNEIIVENTYDELGQLINKGIGGKVDQNRLQSVDFTYNVRGWLQQINDPKNLTNDLFSFGINYNKPLQGGTALFNGNIAETEWKTANDDKLRWYRYSYDALNRIKSGININSDYNLSNITYDKNGNIVNLVRNGHINTQADDFGVMDHLRYTYDNGNKLVKVEDLANKTFGFKDGTNLATEYIYDENGNMIKDANKGITGISYNHLNLPKKVTIQNSVHNGNIQYVYDAVGTKLKKIVTTGNSVTTTEYAGNFIYENNELQFFNHPEGYVKPTVTSSGVKMEYIYQYKDHLGNVRLSYTDRDGDYENIVASSFTNDMNGWLKGGVETEIVDGRVKVAVNGAWEGIRHELSNITVQPGDKFTVKCTFDKGSTNATVRLYVRERNSEGNHILYTGLDYDLQTGSYTFPYTVRAGNKISLHIDKDNTHTNETTHFFVDEVTFSKGQLTIVEESNYYPFGLKHKGYNSKVSPLSNSLAQKFGYNGKELNEELDIAWHDFGARNYEASLGRWMNIDPLSEEMRSHSPYNHVFNNPIYFIDPDGMSPWIPSVNEDSSVTYTAEKGDSAETLASQYGLKQEDAEAITGTQGSTEIQQGTKISGENVKKVTGSEVLKLDLNSKEGKNSQRRFDQYLFARDYSNSEGASSFLSTDFFSNTKYKSLISGRAAMNIKGENVRVLYNIPLYRPATFDGSSTATILSNSPITAKFTSGISFPNQANIELPLYHPNTRAQMGSYTIFVNGKNSDKVLKRLDKKFPVRLRKKK